MQITSLEQLQAIKQTEIVELPSFEDGTPLRYILSPFYYIF